MEAKTVPQKLNEKFEVKQKKKRDEFIFKKQKNSFIDFNDQFKKNNRIRTLKNK